MLPVESPQYQYRPSKNPYWYKLRDLKHPAYLDDASEAHRGSWGSLFRTPSPPKRLEVEVGCNGGHVLLEWAERNPQTGFIGIDWKFKQIYRACEKAKNRGLENVLFLRARAERLPYIFGPKEIDALHLYFPDPWPKAAHQKHRLFREEWLRRIHPLLQRDGDLQIKTDHRQYFDEILTEAEKTESHWLQHSVSWNLHEDHPNPSALRIPEVTLFERLKIEEGLPIHQLVLKPTY